MQATLQKAHPPLSRANTRCDALWRQFYRLAYLILRCFWFLFRPKGRGTLVAIWHRGRLLLIRNGYRRGYCLPGGGRNSGESARRAAVREIKEELGLRLYPNQLRYCGTVVSDRDHLRDHCAYFEVNLQERPGIDIDAREVVAARFAAPDEWRACPLTYQVRDYLERYYNGPPDG